MSGQGPPGGNFNPGAFEFRPGASQFQPRNTGAPGGQPGQQFNDPYAGYGQQPYGQQGYYPPGQYPAQGGYGGYGGYAGYGGQGYAPPVAPQPTQQAFVPGQRSTFVPGQTAPRQVQGFQPPAFEKSITPPPKQEAVKPVSLSIGGAPKAAPSLSIGGAPKAAPSLSIGGAPKTAPSLSIGGAKKEAPKPAAKEPEPEKAEKAEVKDEAKDDSWDVEEPAKAAPAPAAAPPAPAAPVAAAAPAAAIPAVAAVAASSGRATPVDKAADQAKPSASGTSTPGATNFTRQVAKNDAEAILREQDAAGAEAIEALYGDDAKEGASFKSHLNIIFAGHVDSGKSSLGGQIMVLTGQVDKRSIEKYQQEATAVGKDSWWLSYVLDSGKDERSVGKTIEVGRAGFETEKRRYTILDAPGHSSFVPNMISGAAQADVAVLVLSARRGEFEAGFDREGASREHAILLRNNGVTRLILAVNKQDEPTVQWSKERFDEIEGKITPFLKSIGFNPKKDLQFIPLSAQIGQNVKDRIGKDVAPWYEGPSLLEYLDNLEVMDRNIHAPFLMPVTEKYNELGTVALGKIEAGRLKKGDSLLLSPNKTVVEVSAILTEQSVEIDQAFCGDNIRLRLKGVTDDDVSPGFVLSSLKNPVSVTTVFRADISILETRNIIAAGMGCILHVHALGVECTISALLHYYERRTRRKSKKAPAFGKQGMVIGVLIETSVPVCVEKFDDSKTLGRFTLRDQSKTFAIGKITKIIPKDQMPDIAALKVGA